MKFGYEEGNECGRTSPSGGLRCHGVIELRAVENCSCHIAPPCDACTTPRGYCPECGWEEKNDEIFNDFKVNIDPATGVCRCWEPRPLDATKIDWHSKSHTNASMIKEGVYPVGTTQSQVEEVVRGTFGGRFEHFRDGRFKYIAYTD